MIRKNVVRASLFRFLLFWLSGFYGIILFNTPAIAQETVDQNIQEENGSASWRLGFSFSGLGVLRNLNEQFLNDTAAGLSASISGPTRVFGEGSSTWRASVSGGRSPYAYRWRYRRACSSGPSDHAEADSAREVCTEWASGGSKTSFSLLLEHGTTIELKVTDANNDSVTTTLGVSYAGL